MRSGNPRRRIPQDIVNRIDALSTDFAKVSPGQYVTFDVVLRGLLELGLEVVQTGHRRLQMPREATLREVMRLGQGKEG